MVLKKIKKSFRFFAFLIISMPTFAYAYSDYIIAGGQNIGIEIKSKGVLVVGTYEVNGEKNNSTVKIGDRITMVNNTSVNTVEELTDLINSTNCDNLNVSYIRNNKIHEANLNLYSDNGICKTGLYVKDSITGIGTLTYIDPKTKKFGALGHEIIEKTTGKILETENGTIFDSEVINVEKSRNGTPGEKNARYYSNSVKGNIYENTNQGVFGDYISSIDTEKLYKVATPSDVKEGNALIRTVISGTDVKEYGITITKIINNQDTKNIYFDITDSELLEKTGGIIQGMSGSPIIQGDYIIGAVTHVVVDNPKKGYGIFITNMLDEAEN